MTIAQQLKITDFPFEIKDKNGNLIYLENSNGYSVKYECDTDGNLIYLENSNGYWEKREYDTNGNRIYFEDSTGYWEKREYDANGNRIYFETSKGVIEDNRPKTDVQQAIELLTKEGLIADGKILKN